MPFTAMLVLDVGGAGLAVQIQIDGFSRQNQSTGISIRETMTGALTATRTFNPRPVLSGGVTRPVTTAELVALRAAAKWPRTIVVGGDALRITDSGSPAQTWNAKVEITDEDYLAAGEDFYHLAHITVTKAD